jgi:hypothetical protein
VGTWAQRQDGCGLQTAVQRDGAARRPDASSSVVVMRLAKGIRLDDVGTSSSVASGECELLLSPPHFLVWRAPLAVWGRGAGATCTPRIRLCPWDPGGRLHCIALQPAL